MKYALISYTFNCIEKMTPKDDAVLNNTGFLHRLEYANFVFNLKLSAFLF